MKPTETKEQLISKKSIDYPEPQPMQARPLGAQPVEPKPTLKNDAKEIWELFKKNHPKEAETIENAGEEPLRTFAGCIWEGFKSGYRAVYTKNQEEISKLNREVCSKCGQRRLNHSMLCPNNSGNYHDFVEPKTLKNEQ